MEKVVLDKTDYLRLDRMQDDEIDYTDIPETDPTFWQGAQIVIDQVIIF